MNLMGLVKNGGVFMYPLFLCSIIIWALLLEKFWTLGMFESKLKKLFIKASDFLGQGDIKSARQLYISSDDLLNSPHLALLDSASLSKDIRDEKVSRRLSETVLGLKKNLWILGTIGAMSPFIGLLGTVLGIIKSFESIAQTGKSGFSVVASGLSESLICTAAGILVAVLAVIVYNYFQNRISNLQVQLRNKLEDLGDLLPR